MAYKLVTATLSNRPDSALYPTRCPNLFTQRLGREWYVFGRHAEGDLSGQLGLPFKTRGEAEHYASVERCPGWDGGKH